MIRLPRAAAWILARLNENGEQAYVVGGCVRDSLLGILPKDWDICTSARPDRLKSIFADCHVVETGLKHGTLTVVIDHVPYEVTTFRVDGEYTDHRHPDAVTFVTDVVEDLARRDFTVNAMAYHPKTGVVDAFNSQADLAAGVIRCVGEAERRFGEDALRILRALRFAATYGFAIEAETSRAVHGLKGTLHDVAAERIRVELAKMLCGKGVGTILREYHDVIAEVLPALLPMVGFDQHTPYHLYDVWEHTVRGVEHIAPVEILRLTMLLHDSGKPASFTVDEKGVGHAYGHQKKSAEIAEEVLTYLKVDNATRERVLTLVAHHDMPLTCERMLLKRRLSAFGEETLRQLIEVQRADSLAKGTRVPEAVEAEIQALCTALDDLLAEKPCVTVKALAVHGNDLMAAGIPKGPAVGQCLAALLEAVMAEQILNEREALLQAAVAWQREHSEQ